jgi:multiple sugar transport system substrate-binding protein
MVICLSLILLWMAVEAVEAREKKVTLLIHPTVYAGIGGAEEHGVIPAFMKRTGIKVEVVTLPIVQLHEKAMVEWIAKSGRFDVVTLLDIYFNETLTRYLEPLYPLIAQLPPDYEFQDIIPSLFDVVRARGQVYGFPFQGGAVMLFYRKDLFEKYQVAVPKTLDDYLAAARKLTAGLRKDGITDTYAIGVRAKHANVGTQDFLVFFFAAGGNLFEKNGTQCGLDSPAGVTVARFYATAMKEGLVPKDLLAVGRDELIGGFQRGGLATAASFSPYYGSFNDPDKSEVSGSVGWAVMPTAPGVPEGRTFKNFWHTVMDGQSQNKEEAWALMQWLSGKQQQTELASKGHFGPVRESAFRSPAVREVYPHAEDWLRAVSASVAVAHTKWPSINDIIFEEHAKVLAGQQPPEQAVTRMCERIQPLLGQR